MCEQSGVIEVPKISGHESVEAVKTFHPKANFSMDVNRSGFMRCPRIQARKVSRQSKIVLQEQNF